MPGKIVPCSTIAVKGELRKENATDHSFPARESHEPTVRPQGALTHLPLQEHAYTAPILEEEAGSEW